MQDQDAGEDDPEHELPSPPNEVPFVVGAPRRSAAALGEAAKRFPPFWRTKNRLDNLEAASYKSEEDPTFAPTQSEVDRASDDDDEEEAADVEQGGNSIEMFLA